MSEGYSLEYVAGFFDGEGCVSVSAPKAKPTCWRLSVAIGQRCDNAAILFWLQRTFGGSVIAQRHSQKSENHSDAYQWRIGDRKAEAFLKVIAPHLHNKRRQAELALEMMAGRRPRGRPAKGQEGHFGGDKIAEQIRNLNGGRHFVEDHPIQ